MPLPDPPNKFNAVQMLWHDRPSHGGADNLRFCRDVVRHLRSSTGDRHWGLNWKRGVVGDPSHDIIAYRWGPTDTDCRIVDIIAASTDPTHPNFGPAWTVYTEAEAGDVRWFWDEPDNEGAIVVPAPPMPTPEPPPEDLDPLDIRFQQIIRRLDDLTAILDRLTTAEARTQELIGRAREVELRVPYLGTARGTITRV